MSDGPSRVEFEKLCKEVKEHGKELTTTAVVLERIQVNQTNDSKKLDAIALSVSKISSSMDDKIKAMSKEVTLNKVQLARIIAIITPINAAMAYGLARWFVGE